MKFIVFKKDLFDDDADVPQIVSQFKPYEIIDEVENLYIFISDDGNKCGMPKDFEGELFLIGEK